MKNVYLSILYLTVKDFKFHFKKPRPSRFHDMGKFLSSQKLRNLVRESSSDTIRKNIFLSSFKFVTHLCSRSFLILMFTVQMDSWSDDTGNSHRGFPGPNQIYLILPSSARLFMHVWMNDRTRLLVIYLSPSVCFTTTEIVVNEDVPCPTTMYLHDFLCIHQRFTHNICGWPPRLAFLF